MHGVISMRLKQLFNTAGVSCPINEVMFLINKMKIYQIKVIINTLDIFIHLSQYN